MVAAADPYTHFVYLFQDRLTGYEGTRNCTVAWSAYAYDQVGRGKLVPAIKFA